MYNPVDISPPAVVSQQIIVALVYILLLTTRSGTKNGVSRRITWQVPLTRQMLQQCHGWNSLVTLDWVVMFTGQNLQNSQPLTEYYRSFSTSELNDVCLVTQCKYLKWINIIPTGLLQTIKCNVYVFCCVEISWLDVRWKLFYLAWLCDMWFVWLSMSQPRYLNESYGRADIVMSPFSIRLKASSGRGKASLKSVHNQSC